MKLIQKWRRSQLGMLIRNHFGFIIVLVIFGYHFGMGRTFDYARTLSTITLLSYLSLTSIFFSYTAINNMANFTAILYRVAEIMNMDEFDDEASKDDTTLEDGVRVKLENVSMSWGFSFLKGKNPKQGKVDEEHFDVNLSNINLIAKTGELVAVVGQVGWGKSTLLMGIMHELKTLEGVIRTNGSKAFVEQEPFVMSGTIKDNILVGAEFDKDKFDKVVEVWWLEHDLESMPKGADSEIGERGITVSGGQKARISLARAVYSDADIYILDDPLSAVDPDVAVKIFKKCINGYLKDKWRILVTHQVQYLKEIEKIWLVDNKTIKLQGSYSYLQEQGMDFNVILEKYEKKEDKDELKDEDIAIGIYLNNSELLYNLYPQFVYFLNIVSLYYFKKE